MDIEVGKEYVCIHPRKGTFNIKIDKVDAELVEGTITKGTAHYVSEPNRGPGDHIRFDLSMPFIALHPVEP